MRTRNPTKPGNRLGMPFTAWPVADQAAWSSAFALKGPIDDGPAGAAMRLPSRQAIESCYARWLVWLKERYPHLLELAPGARATEDLVVAYLDGLVKEITPIAVWGYACRLKRALCLLDPDADWSWFEIIIGRVKRWKRAQPRKVRPFIPSQQLYAFGLKLMADAEANKGMSAPAQAEGYRNGLMIAFLSARPLRAKNMAALAISEDFIETYDGFRVEIPTDQSKTHIELEFPVPSALVPHVARYLAEYRPILAAGPHAKASTRLDPRAFLWLARSGTQLPQDSLADMIKRRTLEQFGIQLTPHNFRHCAATTIAENNPEEFHIIRIILGHTTTATADKHYIRAKGIQAAHSVQKAIMQIRKSKSKIELQQTDD